jgi:hypothetical protein
VNADAHPDRAGPEHGVGQGQAKDGRERQVAGINALVPAIVQRIHHAGDQQVPRHQVEAAAEGQAITTDHQVVDRRREKHADQGLPQQRQGEAPVTPADQLELAHAGIQQVLQRPDTKADGKAHREVAQPTGRTTQPERLHARDTQPEAAKQVDQHEETQHVGQPHRNREAHQARDPVRIEVEQDEHQQPGQGSNEAIHGIGNRVLDRDRMVRML